MSITQVPASRMVNHDIGSYCFRNKIINGDMRIDQRNAGAVVSNGTGRFNTIDRWNTVGATSNKFNIQQNLGNVTPPAGFTNYIGLASTTSYNIPATENYNCLQAIEGYNITDLAFGTSAAKTITLSFWVRSSIAGAFGGSFINGPGGAGTRFCPFSYTINNINTWEYKTITITGDTSGTWLVDNRVGLIIAFNLGAGASVTGGTAGTWTSTVTFAPANTVNIIATANANIYITGVQLEVGPTATPFEHRPIGTELALCQRYYEKSYDINIVPGAINNFAGCEFQRYSYVDALHGEYYTCKFQQSKRTTPAVVFYSPKTGATGKWYDATTAGATSDVTTQIVTSGGGTILYSGNRSAIANIRFLPGQYYAIAGHWTADAEL